MTLKQLVLALSCAAVFGGTPAIGFAQIPVTDGASIAARAAEMAQNLTQLTNQLQQMQAQYQAITGISGMGSLMPQWINQVKASLPQNWQSVYPNAGGGSSQYSGAVQSLMQQLQGQFSNMTPKDALAQLNQQWQQKGYYDRAMTEQMYQNQQAQLNNLQSLQQQISTAPDLKSIADLQARIQTEQGTIAAQQQDLQMMALMQQAQDKIMQQQQDQQLQRKWVGNALNDGQWQYVDISMGQ